MIEPIQINSADIAEQVDEYNAALLRAFDRYTEALIDADTKALLREVSDES